MRDANPLIFSIMRHPFHNGILYVQQSSLSLWAIPHSLFPIFRTFR